MSFSASLHRLVLLAAVVGAPALLAGCKEDAAKASTEAPSGRPVLVQHVAFVAREPSRSFVGTIRPRIENDLGFRVAGKVERRLVNVGERVRRGQALAKLDEVDLKLQAEQAEAEVRAATASLKQAAADFERAETLSAKGFTATANVDRQRAATAEARSRLLRSERSLGIARNALSYAVLLADADGVVMATTIEPGQVMSAGQPAIRIAQTGEKEAVVAIPEAFAVPAGAPGGVSLWSKPGQAYTARLREIAPSADPTSRTYLAKFSIPSADDAVQLGMTATVTLESGAGDKVVRLPLSALYNQGGGPAVWIVGQEGRPILKPVTVAAYEAREVLVSGGLGEGDAVVTLGVSKLDDGQKVRIVQRLEF